MGGWNRIAWKQNSYGNPSWMKSSFSFFKTSYTVLKWRLFLKSREQINFGPQILRWNRGNILFQWLVYLKRASLVAQMVKNLPAMLETWVQSLGGKIPWRRKWQPIQYSCLENYMERGVWWAIVQGVSESDRTERLTLSFHIKKNDQLFTFRLIHSIMSDCDPMGCSLPGSSVHIILQARILEWVAIPFSRGSSWPRDGTQVSRIAGRFFTIWATRESQIVDYFDINVFNRGLVDIRAWSMLLLFLLK